MVSVGETLMELEALGASREEMARNYLCGYRLCAQMLELWRYDRKRARYADELFVSSELLGAEETVWRMRMQEIENTVLSLVGARERRLLFYRYLRGERMERCAELIGVSRRTAFRIHQRALLVVGCILERRKNCEKTNNQPSFAEQFG